MADIREDVDDLRFHNVHPSARFGTASDRYGGWVGQIYPEDRYATKISERKRRLGGQQYTERRVPVSSVTDYFEHFGVLELDFTFYRPLLEADGSPSNNYGVLQNYLDHAPEDALFLLKAPQQHFARTLRRGGNYVDNEDFLNLDAYLRTFHEPALELTGDRLAGIIFQQEYQRVRDSPSSNENVAALDTFFDGVDGAQCHIELRSEHMLDETYFDWLDERGIGHVFSHWTWLPMIRDQWRMSGERLTAENNEVVARLLTPRDVKYADAYAKAYPFDRPVADIADTPGARDMVLDATALVYRAEAQNALVNVIANNRAWGNAPDLARTISHRILDEEAKRSG